MGMNKDGAVFYTTENGEVAVFYPRGGQKTANTYEESTNNQATNTQKVKSGHFQNIEMEAKLAKVTYNECGTLDSNIAEEEIINRLAGGDLTKGSCSSLALSYIGNKAGVDVLDFRGGKSCDIFSLKKNVKEIAALDGVDGIVEKDYNDFKAVNKLLKHVEKNKEYYLATGKHAAIIRHSDEGWQYLEMQSANLTENKFNKLTNEVLKKRFGCQQSHTVHRMKAVASNVLIDAEKLGNNAEFKQLLGYINTPKGEQMKGAKGHVK